MGLGEEDDRGRVPLYFYMKDTTTILYEGYIQSTWFMTIDVDLDSLAEVVFVRFLHCKAMLFPLLSPPCSLEGKSLCEPTQSGKLSSSSFRGEYLHNLYGLLHGGFVSSHQFVNLSNHLFISVWTHRCLFKLWVKIQYCFILLLKLVQLWLLGTLLVGYHASLT